MKQITKLVSSVMILIFISMTVTNVSCANTDKDKIKEKIQETKEVTDYSINGPEDSWVNMTYELTLDVTNMTFSNVTVRMSTNESSTLALESAMTADPILSVNTTALEDDDNISTLVTYEGIVDMRNVTVILISIETNLTISNTTEENDTLGLPEASTRTEQTIVYNYYYYIGAEDVIIELDSILTRADVVHLVSVIILLASLSTLALLLIAVGIAKRPSRRLRLGGLDAYVTTL